MLQDIRETADGPIFVLGLLQRSGTNFVRDLLVAHPACAGSEVLAEDFLVHHSELVAGYANWVHGHWAVPLFPEQAERRKDELRRYLGRAVLDFVTHAVNGGRPVLKTPSVRNLDLFFELFDGACLLVVVRDGRAMVESGMRSFDWDFETASRQWASAADSVLRFQDRMQGASYPWALVRYEDLVRNLRPTLTTVFRRLGLDSETYDFGDAEALPVRGSSTYRGDGEADGVHWKPVERSEEFKPLERWAGWTRARHERFNWLAGRQLEALGYERRSFEGMAAGWSAWNRWRDVRWQARRYARALGRRLVVRPGRRQ